MPLRLYRCPVCGKEMQEIHFGIYPTEVPCKCGARAKHKWGAPSLVKMDFRPGFDVGLGRHFDTKRDRDNYLAAHSMSEVKDLSGHGGSSVPEDKTHKLAYLGEQEAKLKRG